MLSSAMKAVEERAAAFINKLHESEEEICLKHVEIPKSVEHRILLLRYFGHLDITLEKEKKRIAKIGLDNWFIESNAIVEETKTYFIINSTQKVESKPEALKIEMGGNNV